MRTKRIFRAVIVLICSQMIGGCETTTSIQETMSGPFRASTAATYKDQRGSGATGGQSRNQNGLLAGGRSSGLESIRETESRGTGQFVGRAPPYSVGPTQAGQEGVSLNLLNVPVAQAAKTILGDILKLNYSVNDKVVGTITIQTTNAIPRDALVEAFEAVLKSNGASIIQANGFYQVVLTAGIAPLGQPMTRPSSPQGPGVQSQIVPLKHVSAADMKRLIEPVVPQGSVVRVDEARNLLVVSGTARELADVANMIGVFDVDWMRGMSFALYPVRTSDPEAIVQELETIFGIDKGGPLKGVVRFIPNRRLGSVLVISSKPAHLATAKNWIAKLDKLAEQGEAQMFVYKIENRSAGDMAQLLQKFLNTGRQESSQSSGIVAPRFEAAEVSTTSVGGSAGSRLLSQQSNVGGNRTFGTAASAAPVTVPSPINGDGTSSSVSFQAGSTKVVADEANNALLIQAVPKEYERILRILRRMDTLPVQVMLEAVIAEVTLNDELKFGLKWYLDKKNSSFTFTDAVTGAVKSAFPGFSYFFSTANVQLALDAISDVTKVNVVSAPSLMVMDNRKATLQVGDQVPITTQTSQSVINPDSPIVNSVTLRDTGVILAVTPRVNDSGRVVLEIEQEVSNVARTTSSGIDSPTIQQRKVKTTIVVTDGEVVALGGLIQKRDNTTTSQVPFFGNLPLVGSAFRSKTDSIDRTELVIFIRPLVVRDANEARQVTEEFRARMQPHDTQGHRGRNVYERDFNRVIR